MAHKSILLLSGGLDSTVAAALSLRHARPRLALTVNYGQKAFPAEREAAAYFAHGWGCEQRTVDLKWLGKLAPNALTDPNVPMPSYTEGVDDALASAHQAWVPARNLVLVSVAAAHADALAADTIVAGWNREEGATFPDNSAKFAAAMSRTLQAFSYHPVELFLPLLGMSKDEIYAHAVALKLDISRLHPCWGEGPGLCGVCESCRRFLRAQERYQARKP
jgi:7-cyano-7-deazaguanine synthase